MWTKSTTKSDTQISRCGDAQFLRINVPSQDFDGLFFLSTLP